MSQKRSAEHHHRTSVLSGEAKIEMIFFFLFEMTIPQLSFYLQRMELVLRVFVGGNCARRGMGSTEEKKYGANMVNRSRTQKR